MEGLQIDRRVMSRLTLPAFAKINLCLEVLGKRPDGLYEVTTVMQTISLADWLQFRPGPIISLECEGMDVTADNLILQAAALLRQATEIPGNCLIFCQKSIPLAAGLGGGSADAAVTLRALNMLWEAGLSDGELMELSRRLGADVPFSIYEGTALGTGTGSDIQRLPDAPSHWIVLVPGSAASDHKTAEMYGALGPENYSDGSGARRMAAAIEQGELPYDAISSAFTAAASARWPEVERVLTELRRGPALAASVSGSGPSVFGVYADRGIATDEAARLGELGIAGSVYQFVAGSAGAPRGAQS
jgi:4-diphosphocytidyl-2-C-methyl-D-erythritol kinase